LVEVTAWADRRVFNTEDTEIGMRSSQRREHGGGEKSRGGGGA
jgi:hypothetical protein